MTSQTPTQSPSSADDRGGQPPASRRGGPSKGLLAIVAAVVLMAGVFGVLALEHTHQVTARPAANSGPLRATGIPADVPTSLAQLMGLSTLPNQPAPNFTLTDQHGRTISLADLHGRAVVLEFMDPYCVDICPIVSQEFIKAYHDLGPAAAGVVFVAVNVNRYHHDVASVAAYSQAHRLNGLPSWHFLTGSPSALRKVWRDYHVSVTAPSRNADVIHTSLAYFIDPSGLERYIAFPMVDHRAGVAYLPAGPMSRWGRGISLVSKSMT